MMKCSLIIVMGLLLVTTAVLAVSQSVREEPKQDAAMGVVSTNDNHYRPVSENSGTEQSGSYPTNGY